MDVTPPTPYRVYYDGGCSVCSREIAYYQRLSHSDRLIYIDITDPAFRAEEHGRSFASFMEQMHLRDAAGDWHLGVDAFSLLWRSLPGRRWHVLAYLVRLPLVNSLAWWGYRLFARHRHRFPRRDRCTDDRCRW